MERRDFIKAAIAAAAPLAGEHVLESLASHRRGRRTGSGDAAHQIRRNASEAR